KWYGNEFEYKRKSRLYPRTIKETTTTGRKLNITAHEKQVVFYSEKYAKRARAKRATTIEKALDLIKNPGKYTRSTCYGAAGYVKNISFDKKTGEILNPAKSLKLYEAKIREEEA